MIQSARLRVDNLHSDHPDIAYPGRRIAIFVNGCFWHHHEGCRYATTPTMNTEYWTAKFERNIARDERTQPPPEALTPVPR